MGRPRKVRTPEEEAAYREARRAGNRERQRRRRSDPARVAADNVAKRRRLAEDPEYGQRRRDRNREVMRRRRVQMRGSNSRLLEPCPAAKYASSKTEASFLAGKGYSLAQCGVLPVVSKSSQADLKPKSKSVGVQTQYGRKIISAGLVHRKSAAAGMSAGHHSRPAEVAGVALRLWEQLQSRHLATAP